MIEAEAAVQAARREAEARRGELGVAAAALRNARLQEVEAAAAAARAAAEAKAAACPPMAKQKARAVERKAALLASQEQQWAAAVAAAEDKEAAAAKAEAKAARLAALLEAAVAAGGGSCAKPAEEGCLAEVELARARQAAWAARRPGGDLELFMGDRGYAEIYGFCHEVVAGVGSAGEMAQDEYRLAQSVLLPLGLDGYWSGVASASPNLWLDAQGN